jgi:hypothetical protein
VNRVGESLRQPRRRGRELGRRIRLHPRRRARDRYRPRTLRRGGQVLSRVGGRRRRSDGGHGRDREDRRDDKPGSQVSLVRCRVAMGIARFCAQSRLPPYPIEENVSRLSACSAHNQGDRSAENG